MNNQFRYKLYWILMMKSKDNVFGKHYSSIKNLLLNVIQEKLGEKSLKEMINSCKINTLIQQIDIQEEYKEKLKIIIEKHNIFDEPIVNPFNPNILIQEIDIQNIEIKNSATKPIMIPFNTNKGKQKI